MSFESPLNQIIFTIFNWLVLIFAVESIIALLVNPEHHFETVGNQTEDQIVSNRSETFRTRAATFAGFAIAIATFLLSSDISSQQLRAPIQMTWLSLGFLLVSYQLKSLTRTDRLWYLLQERTFEYGFLALIGVIFILANIFSIAPRPYLQIAILTVFAIRLRAVYLQLKGLRQMWNRSENDSRINYLINLIIRRFEEMRGE